MGIPLPPCPLPPLMKIKFFICIAILLKFGTEHFYMYTNEKKILATVYNTFMVHGT